MSSKENLTDLIDARRSGHPLILVSNREPYRHSYVGGAIEWEQPASGVTAALEPIMRTCGGRWIEHGSVLRIATSTDGRGNFVSAAEV